jgi:transcriptional regulator with XRE-family HTH domain
MGSARRRQKRLAKKLLQIRASLGLSQIELVKHLGVEGQIDYTTISKYELDKNEPPLLILLAYARLANVCLDYLVDDEIELPNKLPGTFNHGPSKRKNKTAQK